MSEISISKMALAALCSRSSSRSSYILNIMKQLPLLHSWGADYFSRANAAASRFNQRQDDDEFRKGSFAVTASRLLLLRVHHASLCIIIISSSHRCTLKVQRRRRLKMEACNFRGY